MTSDYAILEPVCLRAKIRGKLKGCIGKQLILVAIENFISWNRLIV